MDLFNTKQNTELLQQILQLKNEIEQLVAEAKQYAQSASDSATQAARESAAASGFASVARERSLLTATHVTDIAELSRTVQENAGKAAEYATDLKQTLAGALAGQPYWIHPPAQGFNPAKKVRVPD